MKNGLIGAGITGALLVGGYALFTDNGGSSSFDSRVGQPYSDTYIRTDNPSETRTRISPGVADKDCPDFSTQREAQDFFIENGGPLNDPHNLDRDGDGDVCEALP